MPEPTAPPSVIQKAAKPPGVLPKNTQTYLIVGLALLMVLVIAFSGKNPPKKSASTSAPATSVVDPNAARIQEYSERIEEQTRKLKAEQALLSANKQALGVVAAAPSGALQAPTPAPPAYSYPYPPALRSDNGIAAEKAKREYESYFASNIALTYRKDLAATPPWPPLDYRALTANPALYAPALAAPGWPMPAWMAPAATIPAAVNGTPAAQPMIASGAPDASTVPERAKTAHDDPELRKADGNLYRLFEGTVMETVLTNRLDGTFSGPVNCMVTTPVYSHDGQHMLVPAGTRVLGEVHKVDTFGQERLAVVFHRLIMPDGYSASLDQFRGLNQIGETGLKDLINHHYAQIFGVSLAIGAIAGLAQANTNYGVNASAADTYRQGVASSLSQSSIHILDRYLNVLPTFTIREGQRVKVILSDDLRLPAFENHRLPSDL